MSVLADVILRDTIGNRPAASSSNDGYLFLATDENGGTMYRSNGSTWEQVARSVDLNPAEGAIPTGGSTGQMLVKASGDDYDTAWADQPAAPISFSPQFSLEASGTIYFLSMPTPGYGTQVN